MEKMREEFEAWAIEKDLDTSHYIDNGEMGDYCDVVTQYAWLGWKASRSALCVELPAHWYDEKNSCHVMSLTEVTNALDKSGVPYA